MKALAIAPQPFFSPRGTPLSVYYRTLVTAELGYQVDLLTYGQGADVEIPGVRIVRIPDFPWLGAVKVGPSFLKAFLDLFVIVWAIGMMARHRYDVVHAHEESIFFCRYLKPVFRFKLIYDLHSILSQQLSNFAFTRSRLLIGLFRRLEDGCIARADAVITISPALADYARARVREPDRHFLIENSLFDEVRLRGNGTAPAEADRAVGTAADRSVGTAPDRSVGTAPDRSAGTAPDRSAEDAADRAASVAADSTPDKVLDILQGERPVILYAGTFESYQGISLLLRAFTIVRERRPDAFLLLLGGRSDQVAARRVEAEDLEVADACAFAGQVPRPVAQRATAAAAVLTSPRTVGSNTPLKIYEQIASGVPLVATRIASHTQVLGDEHCVLVDPDPEAMATGLLDALAGGAAIDEKVAGARRLYEERYSPAVYRGKMRRLFEKVRA